MTFDCTKASSFKYKENKNKIKTKKRMDNTNKISVRDSSCATMMLSSNPDLAGSKVILFIMDILSSLTHDLKEDKQ